MNKHKTRNYEIIDAENAISPEIIKKCSGAYSKNKRFFGKDCKFFQIRIANDEKEFKKLAGKYYLKYLKGVGIKGKIVIIRSLQTYKINYKRFGGTSDFEILLAHEINHIFARQIHVYNGPFWFTEGLAMYVAGQVPGKTYKRKVMLTKENARFFMFYRLIMKKQSNEMYIFQYFGVKYLVDNFGKNKLLELIRTYPEKSNKKEFENRFKKIYGITYASFLKEFVNSFSQEK